MHGLLMSLGFMPIFMIGFALTSLPRWLDQPQIEARSLRWAAVSMSLAWLGALVADVQGWREMAGLAIAVSGGTLSLLAGSLLIRCRWPGARSSFHARGISIGLVWIGLCQLGAAQALRTQQMDWLQTVQFLGLELGVGGVFVLALQRLTPFVHEQAWPRPGLLGGLLLCLLLRCALYSAERWAWSVPPFLHALAVFLLLAIAVGVWRDARDPALAVARRAPLVAQFYLGYLWLSLCMGLEAVAQWLLALGSIALAQGGRMASLHALTLGFMGTILLAMVSRVTALKWGRSLAVDRGLVVMQALLQLTTLARILASLPLEALAVGFREGSLRIAALSFASVALAWLSRYGPWLFAAKGR